MRNYKSFLIQVGILGCLAFGSLNLLTAPNNETGESYKEPKIESYQKPGVYADFNDIKFCTLEHIVGFVKNHAYITAEDFLTDIDKDVLDIKENELEVKVHKYIKESDSMLKEYMENNYEGTLFLNTLKKNSELKNKVNFLKSYIPDIQPEDMNQNPYIDYNNQKESLKAQKDIYKALLTYSKENYIRSGKENNSIILRNYEKVLSLGESLGTAVFIEILEKHNPDFAEDYLTKK